MWVAPKKSVDCSAEILRRGVLISPGGLYGAGSEFGLSFANVAADDISKGIGIIAEILST